MSESGSDVNPLDALAEEFVARHRAGERPSLDEFIARRPDLAGDIRELFPGLVVMEGVRPDRGDSTGPFAPGPAGRGGVTPPLQRLGDYRVLREVGRGGMGVVYEAEQESLGRHVALKVLPAHALLDPQRLRRFHREAKAAARLHHTNIVPVYGVGEQDGLHYYVMQFIQGQGLDQVLDEVRKLRPAPPPCPPPPAGGGEGWGDEAQPSQATASAASAAQSLLTGRFEAAAPAEGESPPGSGGSSSAHLPGLAEGAPPSRSGREYWRSAARVGVQVGDALAFAHVQGVLHRDVKPSNLLLDARGNVWVTDFGLAKSADGEDLTRTGDIVGTLRYMAPECFSGKGDARADVYSLGLTLYEMLTLRPAFAGTDRQQLLAQVMHGEPPRPRSVNRDVPRDLETVVLKAIARDPAHRYQNAAELADDLRRFVDDRPVRARRVGMAEQLWRWGRRNPVVAGLTATVVALLLAGTAGSAAAAYYFSRANHDIVAKDFEIQQQAALLRRDAEAVKSDAEHLKQANALMESARLHADAGQNDLALADYTAAIEQRPDVSTVWLTRGQFYLQFYCWDEAADDFARGFELQPPADPGLWLSHARLRLYVGDRDGYCRVCAAMLDKFGQTTDLGTMGDVASACTAGPDALDDYGRLIQLLEKPATDGTHPGLFDALLSVYWRAGRAEQALRLKASPMGVNSGWLGAESALAHHAVGQDDKARKQLADLNQDMDNQLNGMWGGDPTGSLQSFVAKYDLGTYLLCREAVEQLKGLGAVEHPLYWIMRGRGRAALGQWDAASADVARAIALRPDDPEPRLEHSRLLAAQGRWKEAAADYDEALRQHPDQGDLWLERGRLYAKQARWDEAAADFNRALEHPNFSYYTTQNGVIVATLPAEMLEPEAAFDALIRLRPHDARLWEQHAQILDGAGKVADAAAAYAKAVEAAPDDLTLRYDRGVFFGQHQRWDEAAADFALVLERLPASPELGHLGPQVYSQLQAWDQALDRTLALRPADGLLYAARARWRVGRKEWDEALAAFGEALKRLPDDPGLHRERGTLYAQYGRWKEAAADFDAVVGRRPFGDDWFADACLHRLSGDADGFRKLCVQAAEKYARTTDGTEAYVAGRMAATAPDSGLDPALLVRWEERAVADADAFANPRMVSNTGDYTNWPLPSRFHALGLAHYRAGQFEQAARWFRDSTNAAKESPELQFVAPLNGLGLALAYRRLNRPDEARQERDKATTWLKEANAHRPAAEAEFAPPDVPLSDWLEYQLLRREAEAP